MVSVIVVTYNQEDTLARTLESILMQEFDDEFEILIGDDSSTDGTQTVCRRYAEMYPGIIRYMRREKNMGVVANYFDCIAQARGEYLADCAGDDFWVDKHKLQRQFDYLESHPDVTLVATDWLACDPDGSNPHRLSSQPEIETLIVYRQNELIPLILSQQAFIHLCSALYRKVPIVEAVNKVPHLMVDADLPCEDLQIELMANAAGKVVVLPGVSLYYSVGHDSISHRIDPTRMFNYTYKVARQAHILADHFGVQDDGVRSLMQRRIDLMSAMAYKSGDRALFDRLLAFVQAMPYRGGIKSRVYKAVCSSPALWRLALKFKFKK